MNCCYNELLKTDRAISPTRKSIQLLSVFLFTDIIRGLIMKKLSQERLKEVLHYNPETGIFTWLLKKAGVPFGKRAGCLDDKGNASGYRNIVIDQRKYSEHRLAWLYMKGYFPENDVDHINRDPADNSFQNLREVSRQCNIRNNGMSKRNKSGITGVTFDKELEKWRAAISVNYKYKHLGFYENKIDAAYARWQAEVKYGFPNCNSTSSAFKYLKHKEKI